MVPVIPPDTELVAASPDERLELALSELRESVSQDLLALLSQVSPEYFENIVLDLLHRMGYGTSRADLKRVGRSGDEGIDGVISLDRLGLKGFTSRPSAGRERSAVLTFRVSSGRWQGSEPTRVSSSPRRTTRSRQWTLPAQLNASYWLTALDLPN